MSLLNKNNLFVYMTLVLMPVLFGCSSNNDPNVKVINNEIPKYQDDSFVSLERLYRIPTYFESGNDSYEIDKIANMRVDKDQNLYVLSTFNSEIVVFDPDGKYLRKFGGAGQGPTELDNPGKMFIEGESIFIFEGFSKYKELSLEGEYISSSIVPRDNYFTIDKVDDSYYVFKGSFEEGGFTTLTLKVIKLDRSFRNSVTLYEKEILFSDLKFNAIVDFWLAVNENGDFYYPRDNWKEYMIDKYDGNGELLLSFGRDYDPDPYSNEAREYYEKVNERGLAGGSVEELPKYPYVAIRKTLVDSRGNLWVVAGEILDESYNPDFESTIDIFSPEGIWLDSFKSNAISRYTDIHNDRIYTISLIEDKTEMQYIDVYQIIYNY